MGRQIGGEQILVATYHKVSASYSFLTLIPHTHDDNDDGDDEDA